MPVSVISHQLPELSAHVVVRHFRVVRVIARASSAGFAVSPSGFDALPPLLQSLRVLPKMLRRYLVLRQILVPVQDRQTLLDSDLEEPGDLRYSLDTSGVEGTEVSGSTGGADESEPDATLSEFFA